MRLRPTLFALLATACQSPDRATVSAPPGTPTPVAIGQPLQIDTRVTQVSTLFAAADPAPTPRDLAKPYSLTASDGSGLILTKLDAKAVVEGPLAFTELHLYFHNPEARTREGTFAITLPPGAAVSRFAMETDGQLVEAEVVEKQLARRAYDDFLHRKQDPALLEKGAGNEFTAKIFPIPGNTAKHVVLSYSQEVKPGSYTLPLRGLAKADAIDVRVQVRAHDGAILEQTFAQRAWVADRDVVVAAEQLVAPAAIAAGDLAAARVAIAAPNATETPASITILVDTSGSRALGFAAYAARVQQLVTELATDYGAALPIQVVAYDQVTQSIYDGAAGDAKIADALVARGAFGASDLAQALAWLGEHAPKSRVVVVGDGVVTAGAEGAELAAVAKQLATKGVERIDVALAGGIRDDKAAIAIARSAGLARTGAVLDLDGSVDEVARRIGLAVRTELPISVAGATWMFPRTIAAAQPGDEVTIFVRRGAQAQNLAITIGGTTTTFQPIGVTDALIGRAVASSEIADMDARLTSLTGEAAKQLKAEIVAKSVANRVVSSQTSMLVLERDADYARYGIDRTALADILAIGPQGVELVHRVAPAPQQQLAVDPTTKNSLDEKQKIAANEEPKAEDAKERDKDAEKAPDLADRLELAKVATGAEVEGKPDESERRVAPGAAAGSAAPPPPPPADAPRMERPAPSIRADRNFEGVASRDGASDDGPQDRGTPALKGPLAEIDTLVKRGQLATAFAKASKWHVDEPGDVLALIGLGQTLEARRDLVEAGRVYGSIIDLFPNRADFRRFAGERLSAIGAEQRKLVIDTYRRAVADRPDHLTGHRLLAYALVRDGQFAGAFSAILAGIDHAYPNDRFRGGDRVLSEDAGMIAAALIKSDKSQRDAVMAELAKRDLPLATKPSTRFIMYWETDANDVDFHIRDARGGHAWYSNMNLRSGGELYADITTGYGPECFAIDGKPTAGPYQLSINYYSQGPMGYGMGLLQIQTFDGTGGLAFEDRPYVIMNDHAFVNLGSYKP